MNQGGLVCACGIPKPNTRANKHTHGKVRMNILQMGGDMANEQEESGIDGEGEF